MAYEFLDETHPIWDEHHEEWARRERLLRGGVEVIETELEKFEWEEESGTHYANRKNQAVYPEFGDVFLRTMIGHVLRERPAAGDALSFGELGSIDRDDGQTSPSRAEMIFYNVNGTGGDGQQFWQWIAAVFQRAGATGLRWGMVEMPPWVLSRAKNEGDEIAGHRPYAVEFSPRVVRNWKIERGQLQWCVIRIVQDTRRVVDGSMQGSAAEQGYYLLVRTGYQGLGSQFEEGGWWRFDGDKELIPDTDNQRGHGTWDKTMGEIPMGLAVWEWEDSAVVESDDSTIPAMARSATTTLDNLSVAYMNAVSAWRSNMWRAAGGPTMLLGVDDESWNIARAQWMSGASLMGVPTSGDGKMPQVAHSGAAAVESTAFAALLEHMTGEAERMMVQLAASTPDSSGRSKEAGFAETKSPRLTLLAENMESFINTLLRFFELRFGIARPTAYVTMPREFDLAPVEQDIRDFFDTFRRSQLRSAILETEAVIRLAEKKGLVNDENRDAVKNELLESAKASATAGAQEESFLREVLNGGRGGGGNEPGPEPAADPVPAGGGE